MAAVPSRGFAAAAKLHVAPAASATHDLYERYERQIYRFCLQRLRSREEAEDATQTTFLNAFRGLERGVTVEFEAAWLYKIALHVCLSRQRTAGRGPGVDLEAVQDRLPAREADHDELFGLADALRQMPQQQRRALLLREWQGFSYREIGDALGLSQAAVETLLFRARRSLAESLSDPTMERRRRGRPPGAAAAKRVRATQLHPQLVTNRPRLVAVGGGTSNE